MNILIITIEKSICNLNIVYTEFKGGLYYSEIQIYYLKSWED